MKTLVCLILKSKNMSYFLDTTIHSYTIKAKVKLLACLT